MIFFSHLTRSFSVRVVGGAIWEGRLERYFTIFSQRRNDFEFALSIRTARTVDETNTGVKELKETSNLVNEKMDRLLHIFQNFVSPEQQELAWYIETKGGISALKESDDVLKQVYEYEEKIAPMESSLTPAATNILSSGGLRESRVPQETALDHLREDILTPPDDAIKRNKTIFQQKFNMHSRELAAEFNRTVHREANRIIDAVTSGPWDRIIDPVCFILVFQEINPISTFPFQDICSIWKEMVWKLYL